MKNDPTRPETYPQQPFDLVKEAGLSGLFVLALVAVAAIAFRAPYVRPLTIARVARTEPVLFLRTAARDLGGLSEIANYGPPYNHGTGHVQAVGPFHPQTILGVTQPIHPQTVDVLHPLRMAARLDPGLTAALSRWQRATALQRRAWIARYLAGLHRARVQGDRVVLPAVAAGPVPTLLSALRAMGAGGLLSGAMDRTSPVYHDSFEPSLLFLQGAALHRLAARNDLLGSEWGIMHDESSYPGPWWLTPYTFLYQIPPYSTSPAGDLMAAYTMLVVFLLLAAVPFLPGVRDLPRRLRVYRVIWRDWYRRVETPELPERRRAGPAPRSASQHARG